VSTFAPVSLLLQLMAARESAAIAGRMGQLCIIVPGCLCALRMSIREPWMPPGTSYLGGPSSRARAPICYSARRTCPIFVCINAPDGCRLLCGEPASAEVRKLGRARGQGKTLVKPPA
jgi:hypothetical protein